MDIKFSSMRYDLSFVLRFLFLLSTRIFLSSRFSSLGQRVRRQHVDRHASHSVVHSGLFDEKFVCCQKTDQFFCVIPLRSKWDACGLMLETRLDILSVQSAAVI